MGISACNGKAEVVRFLVDAKAEVNKTSTQGLTPLRAATMQGYEEIKLCLVEHGAVMDEAECGEGEDSKNGDDSSLGRGIGRWANAHRNLGAVPDAEFFASDDGKLGCC